MTFEPQNKLEASLVRAATDPAQRPQFYRDFVESDIFFVQQGRLPETPGSAPKGFPIGIQAIEIDGKAYLPIFSSLPRLQAVLDGRELANYIAINAFHFLGITRGADLVLNPGAECGLTLSAAEIATILDGSIWEQRATYALEKDTICKIREPANYPGELADALSRFFKKRREVKRAWLANFLNPERDQTPCTLVAIEVTGSWDQIIAEVCLVAQHIPVPDPPVHALQIPGGGDLDDYFLKESRPFYERRFLGIF